MALILPTFVTVLYYFVTTLINCYFWLSLPFPAFPALIPRNVIFRQSGVSTFQKSPSLRQP